MEELKNLFNRQVTVRYADRKIPNAYGKTWATFFDSVLCFGRKTTTFAYLGIPNGEEPDGGFPAIVLVHGGGGCAFYEWVEYWNKKGYAAIAFDCDGRQYGSCEHDGKGTAEVNPEGRMQSGDYGLFGHDTKEIRDSWTYYNVANIILCNNILRSNGRINKDKIGLTGISWGAVLTITASGIDDRFIAFAPVYGTGNLLRCKVYDGKNTEKLSPDEWGKIYDPTNYIIRNQKPTLFSFGMNDTAFTPESARLTYERTGGKITYSYRMDLAHYHRWRDEEGMIHVARFMDLHCKALPLPFEIVKEERTERELSIRVRGERAVKRVYFNYTASTDEDCLLWKWEQIEIPMYEDTAKIVVPEGAKYFFFEVSDGNKEEFVLSSSLQIEK